MERNFNNVDFERFIKNSTDQYRMYPSEKVWKGINNTLHPGKKWFGLGLVLLLIGGGASTMFIINSQKTDIRDTATPKEIVTAVQPLSFSDLKTIPSNKLQQSTAIHSIQVPAALNAVANELTSLSPLLATKKNILPSIVPATENIAQYPPLYTAAIQTDIKDQDEYLTGIKTKAEKQTVAKSDKPVLVKNPQTIESVVNSYTHIKRKNRVTFQAFFTPTISYRKLSENKRYDAPSGIPYGYRNYYTINEVVTHKPDMGLELGVTGKYAISKGLRAKAGLQFNMTRYEIKAFNNPLEIATIALNNGYRVDSLNTLSNYRNFNGTSTNWLKNFYFQVSLPVGAEMKLLGDDKIEFGIASTIQPTYILGDRAYLISSDYKNYSEVPSLVRRWNVNTSVETYLAYSTGKLNWQVGPQVRYQLLSSFVNKYPVKENLFDFGFKVGIGLNK